MSISRRTWSQIQEGASEGGSENATMKNIHPEGEPRKQAGNRLQVKHAKSLLRTDFHRSAKCLDGDGAIRLPRTACFYLMRWF